MGFPRPQTAVCHPEPACRQAGVVEGLGSRYPFQLLVFFMCLVCHPACPAFCVPTGSPALREPVAHIGLSCIIIMPWFKMFNHSQLIIRCTAVLILRKIAG